jgi:hypothetical protein
MEDRHRSFVPALDRVNRRASRLKALLKMGGTLENRGATLHILHLRIDMASIAGMDEAVWCQVARNIIEDLDVDLRMQVARERGDACLMPSPSDRQ